MEIQDSLVFDRLRTELGEKDLRRIIKNKVRPIAMDLVCISFFYIKIFLLVKR